MFHISWFYLRLIKGNYHCKLKLVIWNFLKKNLSSFSCLKMKIKKRKFHFFLKIPFILLKKTRTKFIFHILRQQKSGLIFFGKEFQLISFICTFVVDLFSKIRIDLVEWCSRRDQKFFLALNCKKKIRFISFQKSFYFYCYLTILSCNG